MKYLNYNFAENSNIYWENGDNQYLISQNNISEEYDVIITVSYTHLTLPTKA